MNNQYTPNPIGFAEENEYSHRYEKKKYCFPVDFLETQTQVIVHTKNCNNKRHVQQIAFSVHHSAVTQVCFTCKAVRTNMEN